MMKIKAHLRASFNDLKAEYDYSYQKRHVVYHIFNSIFKIIAVLPTNMLGSFFGALGGLIVSIVAQAIGKNISIIRSISTGATTGGTVLSRAAELIGSPIVYLINAAAAIASIFHVISAITINILVQIVAGTFLLAVLPIIYLTDVAEFITGNIRSSVMAGNIISKVTINILAQIIAGTFLLTTLPMNMAMELFYLDINTQLKSLFSSMQNVFMPFFEAIDTSTTNRIEYTEIGHENNELVVYDEENKVLEAVPVYITKQYEAQAHNLNTLLQDSANEQPLTDVPKINYGTFNHP